LFDSNKLRLSIFGSELERIRCEGMEKQFSTPQTPRRREMIKRITRRLGVLIFSSIHSIRICSRFCRDNEFSSARSVIFIANAPITRRSSVRNGTFSMLFRTELRLIVRCRAINMASLTGLFKNFSSVNRTWKVRRKKYEPQVSAANADQSKSNPRSSAPIGG
jgi:hypothetical protein